MKEVVDRNMYAEILSIYKANENKEDAKAAIGFVMTVKTPDDFTYIIKEIEMGEDEKGKYIHLQGEAHLVDMDQMCEMAEVADAFSTHALGEDYAKKLPFLCFQHYTHIHDACIQKRTLNAKLYQGE